MALIDELIEELESMNKHGRTFDVERFPEDVLLDDDQGVTSVCSTFSDPSMIYILEIKDGSSQPRFMAVYTNDGGVPSGWSKSASSLEAAKKLVGDVPEGWTAAKTWDGVLAPVSAVEAPDQESNAISSTEENWLTSEVLSRLSIGELWDDDLRENHDFVEEVLGACINHGWLDKEEFDNEIPGGSGWMYTFTIHDKLGAKNEITSIINKLKSE